MDRPGRRRRTRRAPGRDAAHARRPPSLDPDPGRRPGPGPPAGPGAVGRRLPRRRPPRPRRSPRRAAATRSARRWAANIEQVRAQRSLPAPETVDAVDRLATRFLAGRAPLFADRCADGRIVDGHGDLIADDIFCLDDGPRALDCLEFDDKLRYLDGLDDVAFLAMDLERLGRPDLADDWLDDYVEFSGDPAPVGPAPPLRGLPRLRPGQGRLPAPPAGRRRPRRRTRRSTPTSACGTSRPEPCGSRSSGGCPAPARPPSAGRWPTGSAPSCSPATGSARNSPASPHPARPRRLRRGPLHHRPHRRALRAAAAPGREAPRPRRVGGARRVVDRTRGTGRPPTNWPGAPTATWSTWSAAPLPTSPPHASPDRGPTASDATAAIGRAMAAAADPWPDAVTVCTSGELADSLHQAAQAWQAAPPGAATTATGGRR